MCSTTISDGFKGSCVINGRQTKGSTNHKFRLASSLQVTNMAAAFTAKKSVVGPGMSKSASGDE